MEALVVGVRVLQRQETSSALLFCSPVLWFHSMSPRIVTTYTSQPLKVQLCYAAAVKRMATYKIEAVRSVCCCDRSDNDRGQQCRK